ncbi:MAG TPA: DUF2089 family protein [bacterium]|nr:DUF2089 family protein [bacterium]
MSDRKQTDCPYCKTPMRPVTMACDHCGVEIRGRFRQTRFAQLSDADSEFLERYLLAGFSIKALAEESGFGYVAIRSRLDRLIERYQKLRDDEDAKRAILDRLEKGEITPSEAAEAIERL